MADTRRQILVRPGPDQAILFVMEHEGLRLEPYRDVAGYWTIGVGHLVTRDRMAPQAKPKTTPDSTMPTAAISQGTRTRSACGAIFMARRKFSNNTMRDTR